MNNTPLKEVNFYNNPHQLDTSSFWKFTISVFKRVPTWYFCYALLGAIIISIILFSSSKSTLSLMFSFPSSFIAFLIFCYTILIIIIITLDFTYIRFVKPFSFGSVYFDILRFNSKSVDKHNRKMREDSQKNFGTDEFEVTYDHLRGRSILRNKSAKKRKENIKTDDSWVFYLMYPIALFMFLIMYLMLLYGFGLFIFIPIILHIFYKYKKLKKLHEATTSNYNY